MSSQKGFTIIELIVVVAIIAVLAAIVLVNVTSYINKGRNAAIKGNLSTLVTNAADYFATNSSNYGTNFVGSSIALTIKAAIERSNVNGGVPITRLGDTATQNWCACSVEVPYSASSSANVLYCVDSTGAKKEYTGVTGNTCGTKCSATNSPTYSCL
jgi:prepilin-type N-terminal cleavage/methylation domain-containing protein